MAVRLVLLGCLVAAVSFGVTIPSWALFVREGEVAAALKLPDGTTVRIELAGTLRVIGPWLFVRDPQKDGARLAVYLGTGGAKIEAFSWVRLSGKLFTSGGQRVLVPGSVAVLVDSRDRPIAPPPDRQFAASWPHVRVVETASAGLGASGPPIPPDPNVPPPDNPEPLTAEQGTVAFAVRQPVGTTVTITNTTCTADSPLPSKITLEKPYDFSGFFYVQQSRTAGIRVNWNTSTSATTDVLRADRLTVTGVVALRDGEKQIDATSVANNGPSPAIAPVGINNQWIGGSDLAADTPGVVGGYGLYNKGMLVRTWGTVTYIGPGGTYCYVDDGSALQDGSGHVGVKVLLSRQGPAWLYDELPEAGQELLVTGISSSELRGNSPVRLVRQLINFGRLTNAEYVGATYGNRGRGLMTNSGGSVYLAFGNSGNLYLYAYPPLAAAGWTGFVLGCLDMDNDGQTFWGGSYDGYCRLVHYSLGPPHQWLGTLTLSWLPPRPGNPYGGYLDGLAVAPDGTFWVSSDRAYRVYHVARDGTMIQEFNADDVSGHEYFNGHLWLVCIGGGQIRKTDAAVSPIAWFNSVADAIEDLDWRQNDPLRLRSFDAYGWLRTWDISGLQVIPQQ